MPLDNMNTVLSNTPATTTSRFSGMLWLLWAMIVLFGVMDGARFLENTIFHYDSTTNPAFVWGNPFFGMLCAYPLLRKGLKAFINI